MTKDALIAALQEWSQEGTDKEIAHSQADALLLAFIDDPDIADAYNAVPKWYA